MPEETVVDSIIEEYLFLKFKDSQDMPQRLWLNKKLAEHLRDILNSYLKNAN